MTARTADATVLLPTAHLTAILAGPGTSITHDAATLLADNAVTVCWTGSGAIRAYSTITPLVVSANLLHQQIARWSNPDTRIETARTAYQLRFPNDDVNHLAMRELRAQEGRRMKARYRAIADEHNVRWPGRTAQWDNSDPLNQAITSAYHYGAAANIIAALGCHPSLGFIHTGKHDAFVYDLADLHKSTLGLDVAFACHNEPFPERAVRTMINNEMRKRRTLETMVTNLYQILAIASPIAEVLYLDTLELHDPDGNVPARINWALDQ